MKIYFRSQGVVAAFFIALLSGCSSAKVTQSTSYGNGPAARPAMIYVADFDLDAANIQKEDGLLPRLNSPGPIRRRVFGQTDDPVELKAKLVNLMAESVVKDLTKVGLSATRLAPGGPMPTSGWLVRGVFTEVQQGNQVRRAMIGLGAGQTDLQVVTGIDDLSAGPPKALYQVDTTANSGKSPGAAATIVLSPVAVPIRFVMAGNDLEKNTKKTAEKIAGEISSRLQK